MQKAAEKAVEMAIDVMKKEGSYVDPDEEDAPAGDEEEEEEEGRKTRQAPPSPTRRDVMGDSICAGLGELEERMLAAGANPADFRLLICFDN